MQPKVNILSVDNVCYKCAKTIQYRNAFKIIFVMIVNFHIITSNLEYLLFFYCYWIKILYWYRYVDDILLLYNGNSRQTKQLHQHIIKIHRKLNFTLETEVNSSMNFLGPHHHKTDTRHIFNI